MKITIEIPNCHLQELTPFLTRQSTGHIKVAKECLSKAVSEVIYAELKRGHDLSASALEKYLRKMKSEYIRLKEVEKGRSLEREDFISLLDENR